MFIEVHNKLFEADEELKIAGKNFMKFYHIINNFEDNRKEQKQLFLHDLKQLRERINELIDKIG